jgi:hypothetical protein
MLGQLMLDPIFRWSLGALKLIALRILQQMFCDELIYVVTSSLSLSPPSSHWWFFICNDAVFACLQVFQVLWLWLFCLPAAASISVSVHGMCVCGCMPNLTLQMQLDFLVGMDTQNFALLGK